MAEKGIILLPICGSFLQAGSAVLKMETKVQNNIPRYGPLMFSQEGVGLFSCAEYLPAAPPESKPGISRAARHELLPIAVRNHCFLSKIDNRRTEDTQ